jgi:hypothetical protein
MYSWCNDTPKGLASGNFFWQVPNFLRSTRGYLLLRGYEISRSLVIFYSPEIFYWMLQISNFLFVHFMLFHLQVLRTLRLFYYIFTFYVVVFFSFSLLTVSHVIDLCCMHILAQFWVCHLSATWKGIS